MKKTFSFAKIDIMKEIGTIGAGRAATSLAEISGSKVSISVPDASLYPFQKLAEKLEKEEKNYFVLDANLLGDIGGKVYFMLSSKEATKLAAILLGANEDAVQLQDEMTQSSLKEVANILLSSYMNALSELTTYTILVDVPTLTCDLEPTSLENLLANHIPGSQEILYVKSVLRVENTEFTGLICFAPDDATLEKLFTKLGIID